MSRAGGARRRLPCRSTAAVLLATLSALPAGGCGLVRGLLGTGAIELCNDANAGDMIDSVRLEIEDCGDPFAEEPDPGSCSDSTEDDLVPGDCTTFGGLKIGWWTVHVTWIDGSTDVFSVDVSPFATADLSASYGG